jgi:hypothetical protein
MGGGKTQVVQQPEAPQYQESMRSILQAQIDLAPEVYAREAQYQPLYQSLQNQIALQSAQSQIDMYKQLQPAYSQLEENYMKSQQEAQLRGLQERALPYAQAFQKIQAETARQAARDQISLYKELQPEYSQLEETYMRDQRAAQQRSLQDQAPGYVQAFQKAQGVAGINEALQGYAQQKLANLSANGTDLSPEEQRMVDQQARAGFAARGTALGSQSNLTEVLNRYNARQAREQQLVALGTGLGGYFQQQSAPALSSFYQQPMYAGAFGSQASMGQQASAPALTSFYQQPMYAGSFSGQAAQNAIMGQQQAGAQYFNPESQTGMGAIYGAYNAQSQYAAGTAQARAAERAGQSQMIGSIAGGAASAAGMAAAVCWLARACFGVETDRWKKFRSNMVKHASHEFIAWYLKNGRRLAEKIENSVLAKTVGKLILMGLEFKWTH